MLGVDVDEGGGGGDVGGVYDGGLCGCVECWEGADGGGDDDAPAACSAAAEGPEYWETYFMRASGGIEEIDLQSAFSTSFAVTKSPLASTISNSSPRSTNE